MNGARVKRAAQSAVNLLSQFGIDPIVMGRAFRGAGRYARDAARFNALSRRRHGAPIVFTNPRLTDYYDSAGVARGHYFHQDLWAARRIFAMRPETHVDVGSRIDGFVSHLLVFMPVTVVDVRALDSDVAGLTFVRGDATTLNGWRDASVASLSSLHAVEHFGLGRYGDSLDPQGWSKGITALARVLAPAGRLYFSVPIGRERTEFNAHRVFSPQTILNAFATHRVRLTGFAVVNDRGDFLASADPLAYNDATYSCGLFEFSK